MLKVTIDLRLTLLLAITGVQKEIQIHIQESLALIIVPDINSPETLSESCLRFFA